MNKQQLIARALADLDKAYADWDKAQTARYQAVSALHAAHALPDDYEGEDT